MSKQPRMITVAPTPGRVCFNPDDRDASGRMRKLVKPSRVRPGPYWTRRIADGGCYMLTASGTRNAAGPAPLTAGE